MLRIPNKTKFKHMHHRYSFIRKSNKGHRQTGLYMLKTRESHIFTPNLVEVIRRLLRKTVYEDGGQLDIRVFPTYPCSKKPLQSRMGKGKGRPSHFVTPIYKNTPLVAIHNELDFSALKPFVKKLIKRLPVSVKHRFFLKGRFSNPSSRQLTIKQ